MEHVYQKKKITEHPMIKHYTISTSLFEKAWLSMEVHPDQLLSVQKEWKRKLAPLR